MGSSSTIEWTDATWNPVRGCSRVSPGCVNCYAERVAARFSGEGQPYEGLATMTPSGPRWTGKVRLVPEHLVDPLRWKKPRRIFANSMSDLFHEALADEVIDQVLAVMLLAPRHTFQVLTKRAERMAAYFADPTLHDRVLNAAEGVWSDKFGRDNIRPGIPDPTKRLPAHIWLGVSVEDQQRAEERIPHLLATPARVRFLSCEPLLGPVDLCRIGTYRGEPLSALEEIVGHVERSRVDWVIVGGESGPQARPMHPEWARSLRDQCGDYGVPFFFKQWGAWVSQDEASDDLLGRLDAADPDYSHRGIYLAPDGRSVSGSFSRSLADPQRTGEVLMLGVGKKAAGRILDGRTHDEFPKASHASR